MKLNTKTIFGAKVTYLNQKLYNKIKEQALKKFKKPSYPMELYILKTYKEQGGKVKYSGKVPSNKQVKKTVNKEHENKLRREGKSSIEINLFPSAISDDYKKDLDSLKDNTSLSEEERTELTSEINKIVAAYDNDAKLSEYVEAGQGDFVKHYNNLSLALADLQVKFAEVAASPVADNDCEDDWIEILTIQVERLQSCIQNLWSSLNDQQTTFYQYVQQHQQGHIPPAKSASQMAEILKTLGLDSDYQILPQTIYASDGKVKEFILKFSPRK